MMLSKNKIAQTLSAFAIGFLPVVVSADVVFLGNFDVVNDTGHTAHGFEIELEGLHLSDITDTFGGDGRGFPSGQGYDPNTAVVRYGAPTLAEYNRTDGSYGGVRIVYSALWDGSAWNYGTPSGTFVTPGDNCWTGGGVGYGADTPCDHFGVGTTQSPTNTSYSWLLDDGSNTGKLTANNGQVLLPTPVIQPVVPPQPGQPAPNVQALIEAPDPINFEFGEALWVKIFKTELEDDVRLEQLFGNDDVFANASTEIEWQLLQKDSGNPNSGKLEAEYALGANAESVLFRYEFYKFIGEYDDETHEARFANGYGDSNPNLDTDVGTYLGAQNNGVNLNANIAAVPLPGAIWLFASAIAGLVGMGRRKSAS